MESRKVSEKTVLNHTIMALETRGEVERPPYKEMAEKYGLESALLLLTGAALGTHTAKSESVVRLSFTVERESRNRMSEHASVSRVRPP